MSDVQINAALTDNEAGNEFAFHHRYNGRYGTDDSALKMTWGTHVGKHRCRAAVHDSCGVGFFQCDKPGKVQTADDDNMWWCGIHSPSAVEARRERRDREYRERQDREEQARLERIKRDPKVIALLKIALGDNDSQTTAKEALGSLWDDLKDINPRNLSDGV